MDTIGHCILCISSRSEERLAEKNYLFVSEEPQFTPFMDDPVQEFVQALRAAKTIDEKLEERLRSTVSTNGLTERMGQGIVNAISETIKNGSKTGAAMQEAMEKAREIALEFAKEHPVYASLIVAGTIIALGVLAYIGAAWVLEVVGFAARGPRAGKNERVY